MPAAYDIFLSHAWKDGERPQQIADALTKAGLRVWFDANEIDDFAGITRAVTEGDGWKCSGANRAPAPRWSTARSPAPR